jgi:hypothetical protein
MKREKGQVYFLVQYVTQHDDYFLRRVRLKEGLDDLDGENSCVFSIPESFLKGLNPREVGRRLICAYERKKSDQIPGDSDLTEIFRTIDESGISFGHLRSR